MSKIKEWLRAGEAEERFLISDISKRGCQGGVGGLIYYWETTAFYEEHKDEIWELLYDYARNEGYKTGEYIGMVAKEPGSHAQLVNDLVWWAVEVRAHELQDQEAPAADAGAGA